MNEQEALKKMVAPGDVRPKKQQGGVMQIWVTRACDKACFGCTQASNLGGSPGMISVEQFETAIISLKDYFGVVGVFGGNPAMHPRFEDLCAIVREHIPYHRRGLWCNNPLTAYKGRAMAETFNPAASNLNVHLDANAYDNFKKWWPASHPFGLDKDSRHSPVYVSPIDLKVPEEERWQLISECDINQNWSAMICVFRGELRGFFCEIAGSMSMLKQTDPDWPDTGIEITEGWWKRPMEDYAAQVRLHCHKCGVPLRGYGELAQADDTHIEQTSEFWKDIYNPKKKDRKVEVVTTLEELKAQSLQKTTHYLQNSSK